MEEVYKVIDGYENYEISNLGNVRNKKTGKILKQELRNGYFSVGLCVDNGIRKKLTIHRLIALQFIPNPHSKPFVDHINRMKTDNSLENLRWATQFENNKNRTINLNNTSTQTGVSFNKRKKKWEVKISINGKNKHIGLYTNFDDAVAARKEQEVIHFKEFQAFQNEIDRLEFEFQQAIK